MHSNEDGFDSKCSVLNILIPKAYKISNVSVSISRKIELRVLQSVRWIGVRLKIIFIN